MGLLRGRRLKDAVDRVFLGPDEETLDYRPIESLSPEDRADACCLLADNLLGMDGWESEARVALARALVADPGHPGALARLGDLDESEAGRGPDAIEPYEQLLAAHSVNQALRAELILLLLRDGHQEWAERELALLGDWADLDDGQRTRLHRTRSTEEETEPEQDDPEEEAPLFTEGDFVSVRVCSELPEAKVLCAMLQDNGVECYVHGEHHRQMMNVLGRYVEPRLMVPEEQADLARELLDSPEAWQENAPAEFTDLDEEDEAEWKATRQRKNIAWPFMLAFVLPFGTGHMYGGAWGRGVILALLQAYALFSMASNIYLGTAMVGAIIVFDAMGGAVAVWEHNRKLDRELEERTDGGVT